MFYLLGGSLNNFIISTVLLTLFLMFIEVKYINDLLMITALSGYMLFFQNIIPMRKNYITNDGYQIVNIKGNKRAAKAFWVKLNIYKLLNDGKLYSDIPEDWFIYPSDEDLKNSIIALAAVYTYNRYMDNHEFSDAYDLLIRLIDDDTDLTPLVKILLRIDQVFLELMIGDVHRANALLDVYLKTQMRKLVNNLSCIRTKYALTLLYENNISKASELKNKFEKTLKLCPYEKDTIREPILMNLVDEKFFKLNNKEAS